MRRRLGHIGLLGEVQSARASGTKVRVLCGRVVRPLPEREATALPTCAACALLQRAAQKEVLATYTFIYSTGRSNGS